MAKVGRSLVFRLREMMFKNLLDLPVSFYDKTSSGDIMSRISHNVELLSSVAARSLIILDKRYTYNRWFTHMDVLS